MTDPTTTLLCLGTVVALVMTLVRLCGRDLRAVIRARSLRHRNRMWVRRLHRSAPHQPASRQGGPVPTHSTFAPIRILDRNNNERNAK